MKKLDNRYILQHKLGEGSMGTVFLARDQLRGNKIVAIKTIKNAFFSSNKDAVSFFKNEFLILSSLKHPNLVSVEDFGIDEIEGSYYLVMEYLSGKNLREQLKDEGKISPDFALNLIVQILRALEYIHSRDIVLRDLKPDNIFIIRDEDNNPIVKILDFGLADRYKRNQKEIKGTASYLAPEVFCGQVTARTDIFATGVIFYEMFTGATFYKDSSLKSVISSLANQRLFTENLNLDLLHGDWEREIVTVLTAFRPQERPASAALVIDLINEVYQKNFAVETIQTAEAYIQHMSFVDKHQEFAFLLDYLHGKVSNFNNIILVSGNSGTGKTRLLLNLKNYCLVHNIFFLTGDGEGYHHGYANVFRELVYYTSGKLISKYGTFLCQILPDHPLLNSGIAFDRTRSEENKRMLISNLVDFLFDFQKEKNKRVVLWFSRFEEANELTCDLLKEIVDRKVNAGDRAEKLIVIADIRDNLKAVPPTAGMLLSYLEANNRLAKLVLQPFSLSEGAYYFQQMFGQGKISRLLEIKLMNILQETEGNPFYLQEIISAFILNGNIVKINGLWQPQGTMELPDLPDRLSYLISMRLNKIMRRKIDLEVVTILVIMNRPLQIEEISALCSEQNSERLLSTIDYLQENDFIKESGGTYLIANQLIMQSVLSKITPAKRDRLKCRIAGGLADYYGITKSNIDDCDRLQVCEIADLYYDVSKFPQKLIGSVLRFMDVSAEKFSQIFAYDEAAKYHKKSYQLLKSYKHSGVVNKKKLFANIVHQVQSYTTRPKNDDTQILLREAGELAEQLVNWKFLYTVYRLNGWYYSICCDYDKALYYYNMQIELVNKSNPLNKSYLAKSYGFLGSIYMATNQVSKARECFELKKEYYSRSKNLWDQASVLGNLSVVEMKTGNYLKAIQLLKQKIKLDLVNNNLFGLSSAYGSLSVVYLEQKDHKNTMRFAKQQYNISKKINNKAGISTALANMSSSYIMKHEFHKALPLLMEKSKIDQELSNKKGLSITLGNLGIVYKHLGKLDKALDFFQKKQVLALSMNNRLGVAIALSNKAEILIELTEYTKAHCLYNESIAIASELKAEFNEAVFRYCQSYLFFLEKKYHECRKSLLKVNELCSNYKTTDIYKNMQILNFYLDAVDADCEQKGIYIEQILDLVDKKNGGLDKTEERYLLIQFAISQSVKPAVFDIAELALQVKREFEYYHSKKYIIENFQQKNEFLSAVLSQSSSEKVK